MALNYQRFYNGLTIVPQNTTAPSIKGDLRYNSSTDKLELYNGAVDSLVSEADTATLTNKTLSGNTATNLVNGSGTFDFNSSGTITAPNATDTLVGKATTDILTNKTLSGNTATNLVNGSGTFDFNSSGTITAPNATDTLVAKNTTDTLTNKTIAAGSNTITGLTNTNLSGSAAISNANLATMAANTAKANTTGSTATPTDVSAVSTATASSFMVRDANANVSINNITQNYTTTATAAGTTSLTVSSSYFQYFTGTTTQTVKLPDATTLPQTGWQVRIVNLSTGSVTVQDNGGTSQQVMTANTVAQFTAKSVSTANGSWDTVYTSTSVTATGSNTGDVTLAAVGSSPNANAASLSGQVLNLQPFSSSFPGVTPASGGGTTNFLRADATWAAPSATPAFNYTSQNTTYSATINDYVLLSGASFTITLPTAVGQAGKMIGMQHNSTSLTHVFTINTTSSQTINVPSNGTVSSGNYKLQTAGEILIVLSDGANWQTFEHETVTVPLSYTPTITGLGTVTNSSYFWLRQGNFMYIYGSHTNGTVAASLMSWTLPGSTPAIDTNYVTIANTTGNPGPIIGHAANNGQANGQYKIVLATGTSTSLFYGGGAASGAAMLTPSNGSGNATSSVVFALECKIPISTWMP